MEMPLNLKFSGISFFVRAFCLFSNRISSDRVSSDRVNNCGVLNNFLDRVSVNGSSLLSLVTTSSKRYCYNSGECKYQFFHFFLAF